MNFWYNFNLVPKLYDGLGIARAKSTDGLNSPREKRSSLKFQTSKELTTMPVVVGGGHLRIKYLETCSIWRGKTGSHAPSDGLAQMLATC